MPFRKPLPAVPHDFAPHPRYLSLSSEVSRLFSHPQPREKERDTLEQRGGNELWTFIRHKAHPALRTRSSGQLSFTSTSPVINLDT